jgi:hypothetical protein
VHGVSDFNWIETAYFTAPRGKAHERRFKVTLAI